MRVRAHFFASILARFVYLFCHLGNRFGCLKFFKHSKSLPMNHISSDMRSEQKFVIEFRFQTLHTDIPIHTKSNNSSSIRSVNYLNSVVYSFLFFNRLLEKKKKFKNWFEFFRRWNKIKIPIRTSLRKLVRRLSNQNKTNIPFSKAYFLDIFIVEIIP